jgi:hypothetical protein
MDSMETKVTILLLVNILFLTTKEKKSIKVVFWFNIVHRILSYYCQNLSSPCVCDCCRNHSQHKNKYNTDTNY